MTTTKVLLEGIMQLNGVNCTDLGSDASKIVVASISDTVEPTLGNNQILERVDITRICGNVLNERRLADSAPITYTLHIAELCGNSCDASPEIAQTLAVNVRSTLITSFNDGSFQTTLHQKCIAQNNMVLGNANVDPVVEGDFVYTLVTNNPTSAPVTSPPSVSSISIKHFLMLIVSPPHASIL
jgi:hypothetical protein